MDKKRRNKLLIALACMALVIGAFALITVAVTSTTMAEAETDADKEAEISSGTKNDASSDSSEKKAAEKLIDKTVSDVADPWYTGNFDETYEDVVAGCKGFP